MWGYVGSRAEEKQDWRESYCVREAVFFTSAESQEESGVEWVADLKTGDREKGDKEAAAPFFTFSSGNC